MFIATITGSMVFQQKAVNHQNNCLPINYCNTLPEIFSSSKYIFLLMFTSSGFVSLKIMYKPKALPHVPTHKYQTDLKPKPN